MTDRVPLPTEEVPNGEREKKDEAGDNSVGSLGAAFLSAGFLSDGSRVALAPGPAPSLEAEPAPSVEAEPAVLPEPVTAVVTEKRRPRKAKAPVVQAEPAPVVELIVEEEPISPYEKRGSWYVINSYSGHEKKVRANLATLTSAMHMQDRIFEVVIPTEKVVEIKSGRKVEVEKRMFPGYLLIRMYDDIDCLHAVRNTPGVTSFVGSNIGGSFQPTPLSRREVERFLGLKKEAAKKALRFRPAWEIGETVRVSSGPFADFNGVVEDINVDQQKVTVLVEIFGRDTPMELGFEDIQKQ